jgi:predicted flap endonuclease-1-like 5' DNA nuclease
MSTSELFSNTLAGATAEILVMLGTSFILGYLMHWVFASNWKKRHESIKLKNRSLDDSQKMARIKTEELESQFSQLTEELKQTVAKYKRAQTNLMTLKEKYSEVMTQMTQFDVLASDHSSMKRKLKRMEKIRADQKEQIDALKVELLNSRIQASASPVIITNGSTTSIESVRSSKSKGKVRLDDLTLIQGIGPKTQSILNENGIQTFTQLGKMGIKKLKVLMDESGSKSRSFDPKAWATEARQLKKKEKV